MVDGIEETFAVEAIASVLSAVVQDDAHARRFPVCFSGSERDDVHLRVLIDDDVKLLRAVDADRQC